MTRARSCRRSAALIGDIERVVGIAAKRVEDALRLVEREHVAVVEIGLRIERENAGKVGRGRRPHPDAVDQAWLGSVPAMDVSATRGGSSQ